MPPPAPSHYATLDATGTPSSPNTAVAMIVLYAVTGCVSVLFCIIIVSGAIKAIRHPERYGPRRNRDGGNGWSQTRAGGLARAIVETFPVVKFGTSTQESRETQAENSKSPLPDTTAPQSPPAQSTSQALSEKNSPGTGAEPRPDITDTIPAGIGRETCPICIVDFEDGDDLRVLPCDGAHRFHQSCVDPWLLELSTACPLCRHDFIALENMISGGSEAQEDDTDFEHNRRTSRLHRFSRYLRFARHGHDEDVGEPTRLSIATRPSIGATTTESDTQLVRREI
ncbi:hypothetical protein DFH08DRAFT_1080648 [Mycena albidolilacea]|uniref:RING-type domain-containing protein n=1 Tax=Mycena albidolilacea TaxID=1033008 RepID=A0AAD7A0Q5_9AGAR|nr:hypothetical protein DFH08DRAFT_1080648 [Mycena albidolilacea]